MSIRDYAISKWGLDPSATDEQFVELMKRQISRGVITKDRLREMLDESRLEREAHRAALIQQLKTIGLSDEQIENGIFARKSEPAPQKPTEQNGPETKTQQTNDTKGGPAMTTAASPTPAQIFNPGGASGGPDVKAPSARYSSKRYEAKNKHGQPVMHNNAPVELPSDREHALMGAHFRGMAIRAGAKIRPLDDHEMDLIKELANDHEWCGEVGGQHFQRTKLATALGRKATDFVGTGSDGTTSGGTSLVPYFYDTDLVTYPLLNGELAPMVDMRDLGTSNDVKSATLSNLTAAWGSSEGSGAAISLQTTDGLSTLLDSPVFNVVMAITVGRDLLSDSPINVGRELTTLMGNRLATELDKVIGSGDGTTQPKGLSNTSGTNSVTSANNSVGPFKVADIEKMISSLPKQYRQKNDPSVAWVMRDSTWFLIRGIPVSSTDQRRIFGYDHEAYTLMNRPVKIQNDISANDVFFGKLSLYRMWRRSGLEIEMSTQGKTLMLNHEMLITARGRYAGRFVDGAGLSFMSNAPLH